MKITNIHKRVISQSQEKLGALLLTLATKEDKIWPTQHWPSMKLDRGLEQGSKGGHGPIGYVVQKYIPNQLIQFQFLNPKNFVGIHKFEIKALTVDQSQIIHTIDMEAKGTGMFTWLVGIRWLYDALIEDAFDQIENQFSTQQKKTKWNWWVKTLRFFLK